MMAKAPMLGRVKTRLAREVGAITALRFHRFTAERLIRMLRRDTRWRLHVAMTPGPRFRAHVVLQGGGDLGARMRRLLERFPPGPVVIVGADIPGITSAQIAAAFRILAARDFVFGPAADGGYWLVGTRRRELPHGLFQGVRWSTPHALADTLAGVPRHFSVGLATPLADVDDAESLRRASGAPAGAA
jgi:rSAM/selenodomain-associated transferase 1